ncbi:MAG: sulfotransferase domain-containing protein [Magnetococcales bacterium]|nr:sulfotransferase domain-containing protein [Magnetococcales bacterium]
MPPAPEQIKTIWVSTAPRTGSMWLYNVTREVLRCGGLEVLPESVPSNHEEVLAIARQRAWVDEDPNRIWVLKLHRILRPDLPHSLFITCRRDPRDVVVSYRRFMRTSFEQSLSAPRSMFDHLAAYGAALPSERLFVSDYDGITASPELLIQSLAQFLGQSLSADQVTAIAEMYARKKVQQRIDEAEKRLHHKIATNQPISHHEVVMLEAGNYRAFDQSTGFQSGHMNADPNQNWRTQLSDEEKAICLKEFGTWMRDNGYPSE